MDYYTLQTYSTVLAILSLVALAAAVGLTIYRVVKGPEAARLLHPGAVWMAWIVAVVATLGSLGYSEIVHFTPCTLCWYQRIAMYPLTVLLLVGGLRKEVAVKYYALPLVLVGGAIAIWHYLIQIYPNLEGTACDPATPCTSRYVEVFGFISIPFMAAAGFIVIAVLLAFYLRDTHE